MFYVIYRADGPAHQLYASTHMFKTRESAQIHAEAYPSGRNAVVVEGSECLLPGGSKISFGNRPEDGADVSIPTSRLTEMKVEAKDLFSYVEKLVGENRLEEAAMVIRFSSLEIRREVVLFPKFRPLMLKLAVVI